MHDNDQATSELLVLLRKHRAGLAGPQVARDAYDLLASGANPNVSLRPGQGICEWLLSQPEGWSAPLLDVFLAHGATLTPLEICNLMINQDPERALAACRRAQGRETIFVLHSAIRSVHAARLLTGLVAMGVDINTQDKQKMGLLHYAAQSKNLTQETLGLCLKLGANPMLADSEGRDFLIYCGHESYRAQVAAWLLDHDSPSVVGAGRPRL